MLVDLIDLDLYDFCGVRGREVERRPRKHNG